MQLPPLPLLASAALWALAPGCAEWPRWANQPAVGELVDAPEDPRALVEREWWDLGEEVDAPEDPTGVSPMSLDLDHGLAIGGRLVGTGWDDDRSAREIAAPGCADVRSPRNPAEAGDWLEDVDVFVVTVPEGGGHLCADVEVDAEGLGWDLLLAPLDDCGVPEGFAADAAGPLGFGRGGAAGGWSHAVDGGRDYAVFLAAYYPNDRERDVVYRLGLSLVPPTSGAPLCPLLPAEASP